MQHSALPPSEYSRQPVFRQVPGWPPYVARADDEDNVIEMNMPANRNLPVSQPARTQIIQRSHPHTIHQAKFSTPSLRWDQRENSALPDAEIHPPLDEEDLDDLDPVYPFYRRKHAADTVHPRQRPVIALTKTLFGYHLFISHEAHRVVKRTVLLLLIGILALIFGNSADAIELFFSIFVF